MSIATGAASKQMTLTVLSHLGLAFVLMLRPFFLELVMSTDLLSLNHPSVLLFASSIHLLPRMNVMLDFICMGPDS